MAELIFTIVIFLFPAFLGYIHCIRLSDYLAEKLNFRWAYRHGHLFLLAIMVSIGAILPFIMDWHYDQFFSVTQYVMEFSLSDFDNVNGKGGVGSVIKPILAWLFIAPITIPIDLILLFGQIIFEFVYLPLGIL